MADVRQDAVSAPIVPVMLNAAGVSAPTHRAVTLAAHVMGACLRAIARDDLCAPDLAGGGLPGIHFSGFELPIEQRREIYSNWLLGKAFQELARGLRESLEEAFFYLEFLRRPDGPTTLARLDADILAIRQRGQQPNFADLLRHVNAGLSEPLAFESEFLSLQRVRNCLEHRSGIVAARDVGAGEDSLTLRFPFVKAFAVLEGKEVELPWGQVHDTHDVNRPLWIGRDREIIIRRDEVTRSFRLGEPVTIEIGDFARIAMACIMFADDLASKLPQRPTTEKPP